MARAVEGFQVVLCNDHADGSIMRKIDALPKHDRGELCDPDGIGAEVVSEALDVGCRLPDVTDLSTTGADRSVAEFGKLGPASP